MDAYDEMTLWATLRRLEEEDRLIGWASDQKHYVAGAREFREVLHKRAAEVAARLLGETAIEGDE